MNTCYLGSGWAHSKTRCWVKEIKKESESKSHSALYNSFWHHGAHGIYSPWNSPSQSKPFPSPKDVPFSMGIFPSPGDLPSPGVEPRSPILQARFFTSWPTREAQEFWRGWPNPSSVDLPDPGMGQGYT